MEAVGIKDIVRQSQNTGVIRRVWDFAAVRVKYLDLIAVLVKRELKVKYRGSVLGYIWSMLNPLLFMLIVSVVFSFLMKGVEDYSLYILSGILFWNMVTISLNLGTTAIVRNTDLLRKVRVPMWIFPVVPAGLGIANFVLSLLPYTFVFLVSDRQVPEQLWVAPFLFVITLVFISGLSLSLAVLNVFFRDIAHVLEPLLTLAFYATPVIYDRNASVIPDQVKHLLAINPFTHFIEAFRATMFGGDFHLTIREFVGLSGMATGSLILGLILFKRLRGKIIFYL